MLLGKHLRSSDTYFISVNNLVTEYSSIFNILSVLLGEVLVPLV